MIVPNKFTSFDQSSLSKLHHILDSSTEVDNVSDLYEKVDRFFDDVSEFIVCLDILFVLGRVEIEKNTGQITYVD